MLLSRDVLILEQMRAKTKLAQSLQTQLDNCNDKLRETEELLDRVGAACDAQRLKFQDERYHLTGELEDLKATNEQLLARLLRRNAREQYVSGSPRSTRPSPWPRDDSSVNEATDVALMQEEGAPDESSFSIRVQSLEAELKKVP